MTLALEGRRAVITGGGRGIGRACAFALAESGAEVLVCARSEDQVQAVADELRRAGRTAHAAVCDVTDPDSIARLVAAASEALGGVDVLVNNAGIAASAPVRSLSLDDWERTMRVNATGVFLCAQAFLPGMVERGWGRVVNVASVASRAGAPYTAAYAASKHAVLGFTRSAALEVARHGVTINCVCPGFVDTDMTRESVARIVAKTGRTEDEALASLLALSPQRRLITPEEVAGAVVWLCDDAARGVNAQSIVIDGGAVQA
jgi:3-hydroxybutyrate dehydrogenase